MGFNRDLTATVLFLLDNLCPPILRDCYPLMYAIYRIACGKPTAELLRYKDRYPNLTEEEYAAYYALSSKAPVNTRPTDLDRSGIRYLLHHAGSHGSTVLDAGCGRGYTAKLLSKEGYSVTGLDIAEPSGYTSADGYTFIKGSVEELPFPDHSFDTVISTHVLEHIPNINKAVEELIRVAKKRVILVLPRQREYRWCADLHIRFFPYAYNVSMILPVSLRKTSVERVGHDWGITINIPPAGISLPE